MDVKPRIKTYSIKFATDHSVMSLCYWPEEEERDVFTGTVYPTLMATFSQEDRFLGGSSDHIRLVKISYDSDSPSNHNALNIDYIDFPDIKLVGALSQLSRFDGLVGSFDVYLRFDPTGRYLLCFIRPYAYISIYEIIQLQEPSPPVSDYTTADTNLPYAINFFSDCFVMGNNPEYHYFQMVYDPYFDIRFKLNEQGQYLLYVSGLHDMDTIYVLSLLPHLKIIHKLSKTHINTFSRDLTPETRFCRTLLDNSVFRGYQINELKVLSPFSGRLTRNVGGGRTEKRLFLIFSLGEYDQNACVRKGAKCFIQRYYDSGTSLIKCLATWDGYSEQISSVYRDHSGHLGLLTPLPDGKGVGLVSLSKAKSLIYRDDAVKTDFEKLCTKSRIEMVTSPKILSKNQWKYDSVQEVVVISTSPLMFIVHRQNGHPSVHKLNYLHLVGDSGNSNNCFLDTFDVLENVLFMNLLPTPLYRSLLFTHHKWPPKLQNPSELSILNKLDSKQRLIAACQMSRQLYAHSDNMRFSSNAALPQELITIIVNHLNFYDLALVLSKFPSLIRFIIPRNGSSKKRGRSIEEMIHFMRRRFVIVESDRCRLAWILSLIRLGDLHILKWLEKCFRDGKQLVEIDLDIGSHLTALHEFLSAQAPE